MPGCFTLLLFGFIFALVGVLASALRLVFGLRRTARRFTDRMRGTRQEATQHSTGKETKSEKRNKHFAKDEGTYVDFEEIGPR